jgi:hypothetical protein
LPASVGSTHPDGAEKLPLLAFLRIENAECSEMRCAEGAVAMDKDCDDHTHLDKKNMVDRRMSLVEMKWLFVAN